MDSSLATDLVGGALEMAIAQRRPEDVIHHSDQGSQYTSLAFGKRCRDAGIALSMGSVGDCYDNAMAESFFASLECELLDQRTFRSHAEAKTELFRWIEGWYNPHRRHSAIRYLSPVNFENAYNEDYEAAACELAPVSWTRHPLSRRYPRCQDQDPGTRQSTGSRWWIWSGPGAARTI